MAGAVGELPVALGEGLEDLAGLVQPREAALEDVGGGAVSEREMPGLKETPASNSRRERTLPSSTTTASRRRPAGRRATASQAASRRGSAPRRPRTWSS